MESVWVALEAIRANFLRSVLTTLGIVIGIAAVIAVVAIGQGGQAMLMGEMEKMGSNLFAIYTDWQSDQPRTGREFTLQDIEIIKEQVEEIKDLVPLASSYEMVRGGKVNKRAQLVGSSPNYGQMRNLVLKEGRFFNETDSRGRRRVVVIDEELAQEFFKKRSPVGEKIVVRGNSLVVIGVIKQDKSIFTMGDLKKVYTPVKVFMEIFPWGYIHSVEGTTFEREDVKPVMEKVVKILERRHRVEDFYMGVSMEQQMEIAGKFSGIMTLVIGIIAGISLLVGGIGVMNIMLVSVSERTSEIGLRMALGARRKDIMVQFLIEAVVLCLLGGIIGMSLGIGGAFLIAKLAKWPPLVSWTTVLLAVGFSASIGIVFGILPANKASKLDPIEALRRD